MITDNLRQSTKAEDLTVRDNSAQAVKKIKYNQADMVNKNLIVLSGSFDSTQKSTPGEPEQKLHNTFSLRMVREGQSTGWKVDFLNIQ